MSASCDKLYGKGSPLADATRMMTALLFGFRPDGWSGDEEEEGQAKDKGSTPENASTSTRGGKKGRGGRGKKR
ncbi:hypothetical protein JCM6882_006392 [Rhodosporidiobolus microsporus]